MTQYYIVKSIAVTGALAMALSAVTASAAGISVGSGLNASVSAGAMTATTGASIDSNSNVLIPTGMSSSASVDEDNNVSTTSINTNTGTSATVSSPIVVTREDLGSSSQTNVSADSGLSASIKGILASDANVSSVSANDTSVSVSYNEPAKLLGIIPIMVATNVSANANGNVTVSHPWYDFLAFSDDSGLQTQAQSQVSATAGGQASADGTLSDSAKIDIISALDNAVKAWMGSTASVNTNASTNASASGY